MMTSPEVIPSVAQKIEKQKKQVSRGKGARRDVPAPKPVGVPVPQRSDGPGPLPWRIVKAAVAFMGIMSLMVHTHLRDFLQNDTVDGWEMFLRLKVG